jgi:hypothetical protein
LGVLLIERHAHYPKWVPHRFSVSISLNPKFIELGVVNVFIFNLNQWARNGE